MQDFLKNRPRVPAGAGRHPTGPSSPGGILAGDSVFNASLIGSLSGDGEHDASVEAIKEGERVVKLIVTCRCGERIEILCAYGPNPQ